MSTLTINIRQKSNPGGQPEVTLALDGNLDNSTVASLQAKLTPTLAAHPAQLIFDLAALKFVTSAGIRLFFMTMKQQKQHGGQASIVNLQPQIKEVFDIMGSLPDVRIFSNNAELDAYLLGRQRTYGTVNQVGTIAPNRTPAP
jgi:anti-sigma B factor antagonist